MRSHIRSLAKLGAAVLLTVGGAAAGTDNASAADAGSSRPALAASDVRVFRNAVLKDCLDDSIVYKLRPFICNGMDYQRWEVIPTGDISPSYYIRNANTHRCLDDSVLGVRTLDCNNLNYQKWFFAYSGSGDELQNQATGNCLQENSWGRLVMVTCVSSDPYHLWTR